MHSTRFFVAVLGLAFALSGCGKKEEAPSEPAPTEPAKTEPAAEPAKAEPAAAEGPADEAKKAFETVCAACHGTSGKGDGPAAAQLNPKPRDYTDAEWQKSIKDEDIAKVIVEGGAAVGKSEAMPPNPQWKDKPEVVAELVKIIRGFGGEQAAAGGDEAAAGDAK